MMDARPPARRVACVDYSEVTGMNEIASGALAPETRTHVMSEHERHQKFRRVLMAAGIGHFVEWFDFGLYGTLAAAISINFFRSEDPVAALLASFAVFAAGFIVRPLGGIFWGNVGDRVGRKTTLSTVVLLTAGATFVMGILPTYHHIGIWAAVLLVLVRLVQGFACGGESSGATTLLLEFAPKNRRGFVTSFIDVFGPLAYVAGSGIVLILTSTLGTDTMNDWGWRIPFLIAGPLGLIGIYLRLKLEDTPEFQNLKESGAVEKSSVKTSITVAWKVVLFCIGFVVIKAVATWLLQTFMPSYFQTYLNYSQVTSYWATLLCWLTIAIIVPFMGHLSDKIGRRPLMMTGCAGLFIFTYPAFLLMEMGTFGAAVGSMMILGLFLGIFNGPMNAAMTELFPTSIRYGGVSLAYNISVAVFGGLTPFIASWLIKALDTTTAPALWVMAAALVSFIAVFKAKETAHTDLQETVHSEDNR